MSYAYIHLKHKTITNIKIFMHSYNELIQLLMLITDVCLYYRTYTSFIDTKVPVGTIEILLVKKYS